jgi:hypothetical protein
LSAVLATAPGKLEFTLSPRHSGLPRAGAQLVS